MLQSCKHLETLVELGNTKDFDMVKTLKTAATLNKADHALMGDSDKLSRAVLENTTEGVHNLIGAAIHGRDDDSHTLGGEAWLEAQIARPELRKSEDIDNETEVTNQKEEDKNSEVPSRGIHPFEDLRETRAIKSGIRKVAKSLLESRMPLRVVVVVVMMMRENDIMKTDVVFMDLSYG